MIATIVAFMPKVSAASLTIAFSKSNANVGDIVTVTVNGSGIAGKITLSVSGNATLSQSSVWVDNSSATATLTINGTGNVKVTATPTDASDTTTAAIYTTPTAGTITVTPSKASNSGSGTISSSGSSNSENKPNGESSSSPDLTKSSNANVTMITTSPVDFSGFKASKTSGYAVTVENDVDKISVSVDKEDSKASVSLLNRTNSDTGKSWVYIAEGNNEIDVAVTSEDGKNTKKYTISVTRKEKEEATEETEEQEEDGNSEEEPIEETLGLTELNIEGLELAPQFQTDVYEYKVDLKDDLGKLNITTLATKANSEIEITGNENLQEGENVITIIVKGENEAETVAYQIIVNKTLEKQEDTSNQDQQENIKKIIILSVAGGVIIIIVIAVIIIKIKKSKDSDDGYIPYGNLMNDYEENNEVEEQTIENAEEDEFYEEPKKRKRSKGKRFK